MAFLAPLLPALPAIAGAVGTALGGIFGQGQQPQVQRMPQRIRAGTPLSMGRSPAMTTAQARTIGAGPAVLAPPTLTPIESLIRGATQPRPAVTTAQGTIAPNRGSARVGQFYYTSTGKVFKKGRKKKKKPKRRRARLTKKEKFTMIAQAAAGGASPQVISILLMM